MKAIKIGAAIFLCVSLTGCNLEDSTYQQTLASKSIQDVIPRLGGTILEATETKNSGGICADNFVKIEILQPSVEKFLPLASKNIIQILEVMKSDPSYEDYGFMYYGKISGLPKTDKYGNIDNKPRSVLWSCFTVNDVQKINLANRSFLEANVLRMNTLGQNDYLEILKEYNRKKRKASWGD